MIEKELASTVHYRRLFRLLKFPRNQATRALSRRRHSTVHIGCSQTHGTQLLLVSSNRQDFWRRSPGRSSAARFQPARAYAENENFAWAFFGASPTWNLPGKPTTATHCRRTPDEDAESHPGPGAGSGPSREPTRQVARC